MVKTRTNPPARRSKAASPMRGAFLAEIRAPDMIRLRILKEGC
jgi:hypothetical protein